MTTDVIIGKVPNQDSAEFRADPLTPRELYWIREHHKRCDSYLAFEGEFGPADWPDSFSQELIKKFQQDMFRELGDWADKITTLEEDLTGAGQTVKYPLSKAAGRILEFEWADYRHARAKLVNGTIECYLGRDEYGYRWWSLAGDL